MHTTRILIFGAGVIGSIYGGLLAHVGVEVTLLARGCRLEALRRDGLRLQRADLPEATAPRLLEPPIKVIDHLREDDIYDYVFVCLRAEQVMTALPSLASNRSKTFVFMVNNAWGYDRWEEILSKGRVLPAFAGAGGEIREGTVHYGLTRRVIQPTVLGEIGGKRSERVEKLRELLDKAGFATSIRRDMDAWQKTHLALVCPLACAIYLDGGDNYTLAKNKAVLTLAAEALKETLTFIHRSGIGIRPERLGLIRFIPLSVIRSVLARLFASRWAETFVLGHSLNARGEMEHLTQDLLILAEQQGFDLPKLRQLALRKSELL